MRFTEGKKPLSPEQITINSEKSQFTVTMEFWFISKTKEDQQLQSQICPSLSILSIFPILRKFSPYISEIAQSISVLESNSCSHHSPLSINTIHINGTQ